MNTVLTVDSVRAGYYFTIPNGQRFLAPFIHLEISLSLETSFNMTEYKVVILDNSITFIPSNLPVTNVSVHKDGSN